MTKQNFDKDRLNKLPIKEVAEKLGLHLQRNRCLCFMHDDHTPSLSFNPIKNLWNCFPCGTGGDVIELVKRYHSCNFTQACLWIENAFGIASHKIVQSYPPKKIIKPKTTPRKQPDFEIYKWFIDNLSVTENVRNFIKSRQYPESILEKYQIKGLDNTTSYFERCKAKWGIERLLNCGLAKESVNKSTGEITYKLTWWTNTLFFPFYDNNGNITYIQGRTLNPNTDKKYKYINLIEVKTSIFNLPLLKTLHKNDTLVITEGVTDCISCCLMGQNAIGILGANAFKKEYVEILKDFDIYIFPDNDESKTGENFANKIRQAFYSVGKTIEIIPLEESYKDISEYYIKAWNHE